MPLVPAVPPNTELPYPISPEYVAGWTPLRALCELVANALDEDPAATLSYADGVLTIEDSGPGMGTEGLLLGYSDKRGSTTKIGIHGEGAKIASLVLARDPAIGEVYFETVGFAFAPMIATHHMVPSLARTLSGDVSAPEVLCYRFYDSDRTRGTRVRIECEESLATELRSRFLHFQIPGYQPPDSPGRLVPEVPPGRIYLGGVLVTEAPALLSSYDLSLENKALQNRDRTVIEAGARKQLITRILATTTDRAVIARYLDAALDGTLDAEEQYFAAVHDPAVRTAFAAVGKRLRRTRKLFRSTGTGEVDLDLADRGYEKLDPAIDPTQFTALTRLVGIPTSTELAPKVRSSRQKTTYVAESELTESERSALTQAIATVRTLWGEHALGRVRVYSATRQASSGGEHDPELAWGGFYTPRTGDVAIHRSRLWSVNGALPVLVHEAAHRLCHRPSGKPLGYAEWADRTRGFEARLGTMAATAALTLERLGRRADELARQPGPGAAPVLTDTGTLDPTTPPPPCRAALAELVAPAITALMAKYQVTSLTALQAETGIRASDLTSLRVGRRLPNYATATQLGEALSIHPSVLFLASCGPDLPFVFRRRPGPVHGKLRPDCEAALDELARLGGAFAELIGPITAIIDGSAVTSREFADWQGPFEELVAAEAARS